MYQYRNLPPRHQPPGFYPPHQPSLRHQRNPHQTHDVSYAGSHTLTRSHSHGILHSSHPPHHVTHSTAGYRTHHIPPPDKHKKEHLNGNCHSHSHSHSTRTHAPPPYVHNGPDTALYAIQQMQRIKAATACQIINNRVVEAIRQQQQKKLQEKQLKRKLDPNWKDPNETNPNNPAYKGPENAKLLKLLSKKKKKTKKVGSPEALTEDSMPHTEAGAAAEIPKSITPPSTQLETTPAAEAEEEEEDEGEEEEEEEDATCNDHSESEQQILSIVDVMQSKLDQAYTERMMTIPQLEISTAPKSTANITNLSEEELKMNPQLYKMYSYYIPFANHHNTSEPRSNNLRSQSLPPGTTQPTAATPPSQPTVANNGATNSHHHRSNMGPRRRNPNFLKPQLMSDGVSGGGGVVSDFRSHSYSPNKHQRVVPPSHSPLVQHVNGVLKAKLVPIGKVKPNPLDVDPPNPVISKSAAKRVKDRIKKHTEPHIAPAHANVQSVISPNGGIYHPCHGYSTRDISIFDLFPGIVKYQSKKYAECDRVDYLVSLSEKSFCSVNNKPLKVDEAEMWYTALKYLFNDITLGQFDYMSVEMRYVIKQYMSTHKNRLSFLNSIKSYGFLRVISDVSKKLPRKHIQKIMKQEREKKEKQEREKLVALQKQIRYQQIYHQQQLYQHQQIYQQHAAHYADWYTGSKLKRTVSEPTPLTAQQATTNKPRIVDEEDDDIDDSWNFITEIVNNNKIPDLPPERERAMEQMNGELTPCSSNKEDKEQISGDCMDETDATIQDEAKEMDEIVDVYTMLYQTMKDKDGTNDTITSPTVTHTQDSLVQECDDNGPDVSLADLSPNRDLSPKPIADDTFTPKLPFKWCNNAHSPSNIWMDNPYAKPSKYFKSKKYTKYYKRGK